MNTPIPEGDHDAGIDRIPFGVDGTAALAFDLTDGRGLAGLLDAALADRDRDRHRDGDPAADHRLGDRVRGHVCGPLCGRPFGADVSPVLDAWSAPAASPGRDPGRATAPSLAPGYRPRHARRVGYWERRTLNRAARAMESLDFGPEPEVGP